MHRTQRDCVLMSQLSTTTMNWQHNTKARTRADWNAHPHTTAKHPKRKKKNTHNYNRTHKNRKDCFSVRHRHCISKWASNRFELFTFITAERCPLFESFFTERRRCLTNDLATPSRHSSSTLFHWNKIRIMRKEKKKNVEKERELQRLLVAQGHEETDQSRMWKLWTFFRQ